MKLYGKIHMHKIIILKKCIFILAENFILCGIDTREKNLLRLDLQAEVDFEVKVLISTKK